ncbi:MAG: hypothetical protein J1F10_04030 [Muribaculaceae bacterium]|nr:hypothetical protein [Muribaculaceae bacterium]
MANIDDDDDYDFFDGPDIELPVVEPTPEEIEEKQEKEETIAVIHNHKWRNFALSLVAVICAALAIFIYFKFFNPFVDDAIEQGYIMKVERRGLIFKTYEGELVSTTQLKNSDQTFKRDFTFSFANDSLGREAMRLQTTGELVTLHYVSYDGKIPWRGASNNIVTSISVP